MGKLDSVACICIRQCKIPTVYGKGESMIYCGVITKNVFLKHFEVVEDIITEVDMLFDKYFNCVI